MGITKLRVKNFRNFQSFGCEPCPQFNLILGKNGSGKTSLLEAIYILGFGKSFRVNNLQAAIHYEQNQLLSCVQMQSSGQGALFLGLEKKRAGQVYIKVGGKKVQTLSELVKHLPVLFISPDSFDLLSGGPEKRRKFMDWGAFHCEPSFAIAWQQFSKILQQRNALLKQPSNINSLFTWDQEFAQHGEDISQIRRSYLNKLIPSFQKMLSELMPIEGINIEYSQGWDGEDSLKAALTINKIYDLKSGFSTIGPQRADLRITFHGNPVSQVLSRGQQKMLVCALYLAQGKVLADFLHKKAIYLIDDLSSELDLQHRTNFLNVLNNLNTQCFITGIEESLILPLMSTYSFKSFELQEKPVVS